MPVKTTWDVEHACGHCAEHDLSAKRASQRDGYARWLAACDVLGLSDEQFATRVETPARHVTSASWWIDQRDAETADIEELVADAASSDMARACGNPS